MAKSHTDKSTTQSTTISTSEPSVVSSSSSVFRRAAGKSPAKSGYKPEYKVRLSKDDNPDDYENAAKGFFRVIGNEIKAIFKALFGFLRDLFGRKKSKDLSSISSSSISPSDLSTEASSTSSNSNDRSVSPSVTRSAPREDVARAVSSPSEASVRPPKSAASTSVTKPRRAAAPAIPVQQVKDGSAAHSGSDPTAQPQVLAGGNPAAANPPVSRQLGSIYTYSPANVREWLGGGKSTPADIIVEPAKADSPQRAAMPRTSVPVVGDRASSATALDQVVSAGSPEIVTKKDMGIQFDAADIDAAMNSVSSEPAAALAEPAKTTDRPQRRIAPTVSVAPAAPVTSPAARAESSATTILVDGNPVVPADSSVTVEPVHASPATAQESLVQDSQVNRDNADLLAEIAEVRRNFNHVEINAPRETQDDNAAFKAELARVRDGLRPPQIVPPQADVDVNSKINEWLANIDSDRESIPSSEASSTEYQAHDAVSETSNQDQGPDTVSRPIQSSVVAPDTVSRPIQSSVVAPDTVSRPIQPSVVASSTSSLPALEPATDNDSIHQAEIVVPPTLDPHAELMAAIQARAAAVREVADKDAEERAKKVAAAAAAKAEISDEEKTAKAAAEAQARDEEAKLANERKAAQDLLHKRMKDRHAAMLGDTSDSDSDDADTTPVVAAAASPGKLDHKKFSAVAEMLAQRVADQQPAAVRHAEKQQGNPEALADAKAKLEAVTGAPVQQPVSPAGRVVVNPNAPTAPPPPPHLLAKADGAKANAAGGPPPPPPPAMPSGWKPKAPVAAAARPAAEAAQTAAKPAEGSSAPAPAFMDELKAKLAKKKQQD